MKTILKISVLGRVLLFGGAVGLAVAGAFADRGRGSIRSAEPARQPVRQEPVHVEQEHRDVRPQPARIEPQHNEPQRDVAAPAHRDWDDNDEDGRHFGGFGPGVPDRHMRGERFRALPDHYRRFAFNNLNYFLDDTGCYYLQQPDGQYLIVQPPVGIAITDAPSGAVPVVVGPTTYYYLDGVFYIAQPGGFAVVNPPPGIVVPTLPTGAAQVIINGNVVYQFNGFNYQPSLQDGVTVYTVNPA